MSNSSSSSSSVVTKYTFTKDVANFRVSQLTYEIEQNATITTEIDHIDFSRPTLDIYFAGELSSAEYDEMETVVAASPSSSLVMPEDDIAADTHLNSVCGLRAYCNSTNPSYQIDIEAGCCRNNSVSCTIVLSAGTTVDLTQSGANGLDTGSEAADTWYAIYVIGDTSGANSTAGLLSADGESPTLPSGYNVFRRIGWARNNSSSNLIRFIQTGHSRERSVWYDEGKSNLKVLDGGSATDFTTVDLSSVVPSSAESVILITQYRFGSGGDSGDIMKLRPGGFSVTDPCCRVSAGATAGQNVYSQVALPFYEDPEIDYCVTSSNNFATLYVAGYSEVL